MSEIRFSEEGDDITDTELIADNMEVLTMAKKWLDINGPWPEPVSVMHVIEIAHFIGKG